MELTPDQAIRQGSKSFALASLFLPVENRTRVRILYQWCRTCDDLIDEARDSDDLKRRLEMVLKLSPPEWVNPVHARELIEGFKMDAEGALFRGFSDLELYCFRVAGVVGLMMCPLIGADPARADGAASALGKAMQLTNICRDIQTDAKMGRVYLPSDLWLDCLGRSAVPARELSSEPELAYPVVKRLLQVADSWYQMGFEGLRFLPLRCAFAIAVAGLLYQGIGKTLLRDAANDPKRAFRKRTVVSKFEKSILVFRAIFLVIGSRLPEKSGHYRSMSGSQRANQEKENLPPL